MPRVEVPAEPPHTSGSRRAADRRSGTTARNRVEMALQGFATTYGEGLHGLAVVAALVDELIAQGVADSRAAGESWATIGAALGVSKQAAQQRYGVKAD